MSSWIIKFFANRLLKDNQLNRFGVEDPYYEEYTVPSNNPNAAPQVKKRKRSVPVGISENDEKVLHKIRKRAYRLDMWFNCLGIKFGYANIIGFVPVAGDFIAIFFSFLIYKEALNIDHGLPYDIQLLFLFNIVVDFLLGLIPIVGDIVEVGYKANSRNFLLLEKHLKDVGQINIGKKNGTITDTSLENHGWSENAKGVISAIPQAIPRIFGKGDSSKDVSDANATADGYPRTPQSRGSSSSENSPTTSQSLSAGKRKAINSKIKETDASYKTDSIQTINDPRFQGKVNNRNSKHSIDTDAYNDEKTLTD